MLYPLSTSQYSFADFAGLGGTRLSCSPRPIALGASCEVYSRDVMVSLFDGQCTQFSRDSYGTMTMSRPGLLSIPDSIVLVAEGSPSHDYRCKKSTPCIHSRVSPFSSPLSRNRSEPKVYFRVSVVSTGTTGEFPLQRRVIPNPFHALAGDSIQ